MVIGMKYLKSIFLCIITGFCMGFFLYNGYEKVGKIVPTIKEGENAYFIKIGSYASEEKMESSLKNIDNYIYKIEEDTFHAYVGITQKKENTNKIREYYQNLGYVTNVETYPITGETFLSALRTYDEMLEKAEDGKVIENIINGVLAKYEEMKDGAHKT